MEPASADETRKPHCDWRLKAKTPLERQHQWPLSRFAPARTASTVIVPPPALSLTAPRFNAPAQSALTRRTFSNAATLILSSSRLAMQSQLALRERTCAIFESS